MSQMYKSDESLIEKNYELNVLAVVMRTDIVYKIYLHNPEVYRNN